MQTILTIFGATGDLTKRKLLPALYNLERKGQLEENLIILCVSMSERTNEPYRNDVVSYIKEFSKIKLDDNTLGGFLKKIYYYGMRFEDGDKYKNIKELIEKYTAVNYSKHKIVFYLAAPPEYFGVIVNNLRKAGLVNRKNNTATEVVFEKPFGSDLKSSTKLNNLITKVFDEKQIYRIDHYLAKELVQTIIVLRFSNTIFEHLWNNQHIDHVQITVSETLGVENRALYYDNAGALRDVMQNHMMQLLALIAMESPPSVSAEGICKSKIHLLKSISKIKEKDVDKVCARGQYSSGTIDGKYYVGYTAEEGIKKDSNTETFAALKLYINNHRWRDIPFYLRAGKRLKEQSAEISILFKSSPDVLFKKNNNSEPNALVIRVQPYEGISHEFNAKVPGTTISIEPVSMDFCHECKFGPNSPEAYERLLFDAMAGDQTLFTSWGEVEQSWKIMEPILKAWKKSKKIEKYPAGSWGPKGAEHLIESDSRKWLAPKKPIYSEWISR